MNNWKQICVSPDTSILKSIELIDKAASQIVLVTDDNEKLLGTATDGDIRRAILQGISLSEPISVVMCNDPTIAEEQDSKTKVLSIMKEKQLQHIPVLDENGIVIELILLKELLNTSTIENPIILMAGGLGTRLHPLTQDCPKPMLKIGDKPILETIMENFIEQGFRNFYFSVNYKAEIIEQYFQKGEHWGVNINYIRENKRMGTAGALTLISEEINVPMIVMNGDILTKVNFKHLLDFHKVSGFGATMCIREYDYQIPYGVVRIEGDKFIGIEEKPIYKFSVNAGIYVLDPCVLECIPKNVFFDMPMLFDELAKFGYRASAFPIREYWIDIGKMSDYERAKGEYTTYFHG